MMLCRAGTFCRNSLAKAWLPTLGVPKAAWPASEPPVGPCTSLGCRPGCCARPAACAVAAGGPPAAAPAPPLPPSRGLCQARPPVLAGASAGWCTRARLVHLRSTQGPWPAFVAAQPRRGWETSDWLGVRSGYHHRWGVAARFVAIMTSDSSCTGMARKASSQALSTAARGEPPGAAASSCTPPVW